MSSIWSGGMAFSYFPRADNKGKGDYGMATVSGDGKTVTTSTEFDNFKAQLAKVSPPTSPSKSDAPAETYAACPAQSTNFLASSTLPPTPNDSACACLAKTVSCQYTPVNPANASDTIGLFLDFGCTHSDGAYDCSGIAADGAAGKYGLVSSCDAGMPHRSLAILAFKSDG
jgi:1,3-beta-glucanosyltransferase GAS1